MEAIGAYLGRSIGIDSVSDDELRARLTVPADLQGPPGIAHGGAVAALLLEAAERHAREAGGLAALPRPLRVEVTLARAVPLDAPLVARAERQDDGTYASRVARPDGATLAEARIVPGAAPPAPLDDTTHALARGASTDPETSDPSTVLANPAQVPGATMCLACGSRNPRGLRLRLDYDTSRLWKRATAPAHWRDPDGSSSPALALVLLDEIGWWLGAMACGECGLSTRLDVTLGERADAAAPLLVVGARAGVVTDDPRRRVWRSRAALLATAGPARPLASAEIAFAGGPAFTKSMAADLFDPSDLAAARKIFRGARVPTVGGDS